MKLRQILVDNVKNIRSWRSKQKLVVLSFDDYGAVRLASRSARDRIIQGGMRLENRFDNLDALETRQDLEALFEVLTSVTDSCGNKACISAYALCANPDFDAMLRDRSEYKYESLCDTFARIESVDPKSYCGAWELWLEGMKNGLLQPQFHGREHVNVAMLRAKLANDDGQLHLNLANQSLVALTGVGSMPGVRFTHAFGLSNASELAGQRDILSDGVRLFGAVFKRQPVAFTPAAHILHPALYPHVESLGLRAIDKPRRMQMRVDAKPVASGMNYLGRNEAQNHITIVRNVVFEPTQRRSVNSVGRTLAQIEAAFRWRAPAIISSHRVNFGGHIDPENRSQGLSALRRLLRGIVTRWPDVRFVSVAELVELMQEPS